MVSYNPHITGQYNPLYTANNQGFFRGSGVCDYFGFHNFGKSFDWPSCSKGSEF